MIPKKHKNISVRVIEEHRTAFVAALKARGLTEAFFLRAVTQALIDHVAANEDLVLPLALQTVQRRERIKKKSKSPRSNERRSSS